MVMLSMRDEGRRKVIRLQLKYASGKPVERKAARCRGALHARCRAGGGQNQGR